MDSMLRLNLGCGNKRRPGFLGVDIGDFDAVDVRQDVLSYLRSLGDQTVQEVYSRHFLEHLEPAALQELLAHVDRVLVPGGRAHFIDKVAGAVGECKQSNSGETLRRLYGCPAGPQRTRSIRLKLSDTQSRNADRSLSLLLSADGKTHRHPVIVRCLTPVAGR